VFRLIAKRVAVAVPMLLIVSFFSFALASISPTDPARAVLGPLATTAQVEAKRAELHQDDPLLTKYGRWLGNAVHGDFGVAYVGGASVSTQLNNRIGATASLLLVTILFVLVGGVALGVVAAVRGGAADRIVSGVSTLGLALPSFWIALVLTTLFAVKWRLFPVFGYVPIGQNLWEWFRSLVLPAFAVSLGGIATLSAQTRAAMLEALSKDFTRVMQANGIPMRSIVYRHALRNAAIQIVTILGVISVTLLGGAVVIEGIYGLPGLGSLAVSATAQGDLPLIQGAVVYFTLIVIVVGLLVDVSYSILDPRVRVR
jgi:peptide/nickel transport system permease protein